MVKCDKCGTEQVEPGRLRCYKCGADLQPERPMEPQAGPARMVPTEPLSWMALACGGVSLLFGLKFLHVFAAGPHEVGGVLASLLGIAAAVLGAVSSARICRSRGTLKGKLFNALGIVAGAPAVVNLAVYLVVEFFKA